MHRSPRVPSNVIWLHVLTCKKKVHEKLNRRTASRILTVRSLRCGSVVSQKFNSEPAVSHSFGEQLVVKKIWGRKDEN